jgi:hypothetical protein
VSTEFDESLAKFQQFLETNGYPREVVWVTPDDLIVTGERLIYIRVPVSSKNEVQARTLFEQGTTRQMGVLFDTICVGGNETFCCAWVPPDEDQAERALMPKQLKLSAKVDKVGGTPVRSRLQWFLLRLRYWKYQNLKNSLFWIEN